MRHAAPALLLAWALLVGAAFVVLDPEQAVVPEAARRAGVGLLAALAWGAACLGAGGAAVKRLAPDLLEDGRGVAHAFAAGVLLWSLGALGLAAAGQLSTGPLIGLGAVLLGGWATRPRLRLPRPGPAVLLAAGLVLVAGLPEALAPPTDTDELYYHLGLPKKMLAAGGLVGGVLDPSGNRPLVVHLPAAALLATGGEAAPRLFHLLLTAGVVVVTGLVGRARLGPPAGAAAALLLVGSWSFTRGGGVLGTDMPAALAVLAALDAGLRGSAVGLAVGAGVALGAKYTAGGAIAGAFLAAAVPWRLRLAAGAGALGLVAPWWARNALSGEHPLFPFAGWPPLLPFQYLDKYGAGRGPVDVLLLPWRAVMSAEITSFRFLGKLTPALLALAPAAAPGWLKAGDARRLAIAALAVAAFWASGPHLLRYLLPGLPVVALAVGAGAVALADAGRLGRAALGVVALAGVAGVPANLGPVARSAGERVAAATGQESRATFLARQIGGWEALVWANGHLPADARVAMVFSWHGYLVDRPVVLGSVEDHIPVRHWLLTHGDDSLAALRAAGVSHVVVGRQRFLRKSYPFVDDADFARLFTDPVELLDERLLLEATLLMEAGGTRVYALGSAP